MQDIIKTYMCCDRCSSFLNIGVLIIQNELLYLLCVCVLPSNGQLMRFRCVNLRQYSLKLGSDGRRLKLAHEKENKLKRYTRTGTIMCSVMSTRRCRQS